MGKKPWAFFFLLSGLVAETFFGGLQAFGADPAVTASGIPGAATYPVGASAPPAGGSAAKPSITVPTPDTIPPPSEATIPVPTAPTQSLGRYRKAQGGGIVVNIEAMIHDRYKQSVVRVTAKDLAGNTLARAMGVGVGRYAQFIAAPLSLVLGSSQQWADKIEITHFAGNKYEAKIALIDEEKNLVLLSPETSPAPIVFASEGNERPQVDIFTISFENGPNGTLASSVHRGRLAAANPDTGLLSVSPYPDQVIGDDQAGTGLLDSDGKLVGMLLPGGRGILASSLQRSIAKAQKATPLEPRMIGVILGRGVLVDPHFEGAFRTISEALEAIRKGTAPKTDPTRYTPARNRSVAPKDTDKVVVKVMPGTYKEGKTIFLPSDISLSGSGPAQTIVAGTDPEKPVILVQNASNVLVAGLRVVPAPRQSLKAPALIVSKSRGVTLLGNVFEAKGGVAVWTHEARKVSFFGNTFEGGTIRGLSCDKSDIRVETNAFVGAWPVALSVGARCTAGISRNLFFENRGSVTITAAAGATAVQRNTFVRSSPAVKVDSGRSSFRLEDNLFFESPYGLMANDEVRRRSLGRNAIWKSKFLSRSRPLTNLDIVRTEPAFEGPTSYDFRVKPGKGQTGASRLDPGADLGAYQRSDFLGPYSGPLARSLGAATGEDDLAGTWGLAE